MIQEHQIKPISPIKSEFISNKSFSPLKEFSISNEEQENANLENFDESNEYIENLISYSHLKSCIEKANNDTSTDEILFKMISETKFEKENNNTFYHEKRKRFVEYLKTLIIEMNFKTKTFFLAVKYLDTIMYSQNLNSFFMKDLDNLLVSIIVIASKYNENDPMFPRLEKFVKVVGKYNVNLDSLVKSEIEALYLLGYVLNNPTIYDFLEVFGLKGILYENDVITNSELKIPISELNLNEKKEKISQNLIFLCKSILTTLVKGKFLILILIILSIQTFYGLLVLYFSQEKPYTWILGIIILASL